MPITTISGALKRPSSSGVVNKVASNMPESLQNLIGIDKDDLDYFEVEPLDDRFGEKPKETKCKIGRQQSPIDVDTSDTVWKEYPPLEMNGHWRFKHKVLLFNEGHTSKYTLRFDVGITVLFPAGWPKYGQLHEISQMLFMSKLICQDFSLRTLK